MSKLFSESTSVPEKTTVPGRWRAVFLTEGKGSSGNWLRETIERDGPAALPKGSRCFVTHNRLENGEPDPFRMWGVLAEDARYEDGKLVGEIDILPSWVDRVEEVAPHTALSVYLMGEADDEDNIVSIHKDVQNGVDLVVHPGREGSSLVEKLYESATAGSDKPAVTLAEENGVKMDQEIKDAFAALTTQIAALADAKSADEATAAKVEADAAAVAAAVEKYAEAERAVEAAELFQSQKDSILAEAKKGVDVAPLIETAKAIAAEAKTAAEAQLAESGAPVGRIVTDSVETKFGAFA